MIPKLNDTVIRDRSSQQSFERGQHYYRQGSVRNLIQRGNVLSARVEGSEVEPYQTKICFDSGGITSATCTCPYHFEEWCKHIVATLLACLHHPEQLEQRSSLADLMKPLTREQLQTIIETIAQNKSDLIEEIETQIARLTSSKSSSKSLRRTAVDPKPIEQQVKRIINQSSGQWNDTPAIAEIRILVQKADSFTAQGDGSNALIILGAIARAYVQNWMNLDGSSGESGLFFDELNDAITEAILSAELSESDRAQWQSELKKWQSQIDDYGVESFAMSLTALAQRWEYQPLQKVLQGEITELGAWEDEAPDFADDLALIRLKILERQGRFQEYLYFAEAEGQTDCYLQMLAKMGRTEEAILEAQQQISTPAEALALARTLRELGDFDRAIQIAKQGLSLEGDLKHELAVWTSDLAEGIDNAIALEARLIAFKLMPSLPDYLKIQELSGEQWITFRQELLSILQRSTHESYVKAKTAIFLEEGLLDDAISAVDQVSSYWSEVIHVVMNAAIAHRPEWVIENAVRRAESIMNDGKAQYYYFAVRWLRQVRAAYLQLGRAEDWKRYRAALLQTHTRKRKLVALLQARDLA